MAGREGVRFTAVNAFLPPSAEGRMIQDVSEEVKDIRVAGEFQFPTAGTPGVHGRAWLTIGAENVSVTKRGNPMARIRQEFTFAYAEIEGAQGARILLDRGIKVHLRDGRSFYFSTSWYWSRSARAAVLDALRAHGVAIIIGEARIPYIDGGG
jgi:hypothetical protein